MTKHSSPQNEFSQHKSSFDCKIQPFSLDLFFSTVPLGAVTPPSTYLHTPPPQPPSPPPAKTPAIFSQLPHLISTLARSISISLFHHRRGPHRLFLPLPARLLFLLSAPWHFSPFSHTLFSSYGSYNNGLKICLLLLFSVRLSFFFSFPVLILPVALSMKGESERGERWRAGLVRWGREKRRRNE